MIWVPRPFQRDTVKFLLSHANAACILDPGLGKTSCSLSAFKILKKLGIARAALVVAPLKVIQSTWPDEIAKWEHLHGLTCALLHGDNKEFALQLPADIYLINPEGLRWLFSNGRFKLINPDTLIVDESTRFKHTDTQRFRILRPHLPKFARRWILTGTPAPNGLVDLFGQQYVVDLGRAFGPFITYYRNEFFLQVGSAENRRFEAKPGSPEKIYERIAPTTIRLKAEDHLEMPEMIFNDIYVDLPPAARRIYTEMEKAMFARLESGEVVTSVSAAAAMMRCHQIANGGIYLEQLGLLGERRHEAVHTAKLEALTDFLEQQQGTPTLVGYEFEHDRDRMRAWLKEQGYPAEFDVDHRKDFRGLVHAWNRGDIPVLCCNPKSSAHGLNLQEAGHHVVHFSLPNDYENYDQYNRRVFRQGQRSPFVVIHHLIVRRTVDDGVLIPLLRRKKNVQDRLLDALRDYTNQRKADHVCV